jgi:uncharacterized protein
MTRRVLGLFAKWPEPGRVKTRLAAATSPAFAADVALAFLRDLTERFGAVADRRVLVFAPTDAGPLFAEVVRDRFALVPQADGDLGRRLSSFIESELAAGADAVVVIGSDSPTLPLAHVEQAFAELRRADVVLGPATDGGYYLVGCRSRVPPIFEDIPWYDVDTLDDCRMLRGHLAALRRAGIDPGVPHSEALCRNSPP